MAFGLYDANSKVRTTTVVGNALTGLYAADGSLNIVLDDASNKGVYHPCGALRVNSGTGVSYYDGTGATYQNHLSGPGRVSAPFVQLPGSAVDYDFVAGNGTHSLASIMDGTQTSAIGALLTAMITPTVSVLLQLKSGAAIANWISFTGGSQTNCAVGVTDTTVRTRDNFAAPVNLVATAGTGAFSTTSCKVCTMFDATGRSIVMNNGTVATDANAASIQASGVSFANVLVAFSRLTVYTSRLSDVAGKALTV